NKERYRRITYGTLRVAESLNEHTGESKAIGLNWCKRRASVRRRDNGSVARCTGSRIFDKRSPGLLPKVEKGREIQLESCLYVDPVDVAAKLNNVRTLDPSYAVAKLVSLFNTIHRRKRI